MYLLFMFSTVEYSKSVTARDRNKLFSLYHTDELFVMKSSNEKLSDSCWQSHTVFIEHTLKSEQSKYDFFIIFIKQTM
jgi:hypothetical protein